MRSSGSLAGRRRTPLIEMLVELHVLELTRAARGEKVRPSAGRTRVNLGHRRLLNHVIVLSMYLFFCLFCVLGCKSVSK